MQYWVTSSEASKRAVQRASQLNAFTLDGLRLSENAVNKTQRIKDVLAQLRRDLGSDPLVPVDHWEDDLDAVGVASKLDPRRIAYISTYNLGFNEFFLELEVPGPTSDPCDYEAVGSWERIGYAELRDRVAAHLNMGTTA